MKHTIKKRGQKLVKRVSHLSKKAGEESKEHLRENVVERISHIKNIKLLLASFDIFVILFVVVSLHRFS